MTHIHHLNGGYLQAGDGPRAVCHCLLLEDPAGLTLVDTGIGLADCRDPLGRVGLEAIAAAGFCFDEEQTLLRQLERLGLQSADIEHVVLTHADPDHAGGLADFPHAVVHVAVEEWRALAAGAARYRLPQFAHGVRFRPYDAGEDAWFGLPARPLDLGGDTPVLLVPLFGHTAGHCGVAVGRPDGTWLLHAGDAYYLRGELTDDAHPVSALAAARAHDDAARRRSLTALRRLLDEYGEAVEIIGYHGPAELPAAFAAVAASGPA